MRIAQVIACACLLLAWTLERKKLSMARILIVDSYRNLDALYLEILESEGHCIFIATSGKEAVAIATREHIDLAIVDEKLPDCKSENLIEELKVIEPHRTVCSVTEFSSLSVSALCE
jgi:DNA-binding NtrC family response regulator